MTEKRRRTARAGTGKRGVQKVDSGKRESATSNHGPALMGAGAFFALACAGAAIWYRKEIGAKFAGYFALENPRAQVVLPPIVAESTKPKEVNYKIKAFESGFSRLDIISENSSEVVDSILAYANANKDISFAVYTATKDEIKNKIWEKLSGIANLKIDILTTRPQKGPLIEFTRNNGFLFLKDGEVKVNLKTPKPSERYAIPAE